MPRLWTQSTFAAPHAGTETKKNYHFNQRRKWTNHRINPLTFCFYSLIQGAVTVQLQKRSLKRFKLEYGDAYSTEMVDIFKEYAPPPLNQLPALYPQMVRVPQVWGLGYKLSNGDRRSKLMMASAWPYIRRSLRQLIAQHPSDLIVSVHPLANTPVLRALG